MNFLVQDQVTGNFGGLLPEANDYCDRKVSLTLSSQTRSIDKGRNGSDRTLTI